MTDDETNRAAAVTGNSSSPQAADIRDRWWWVEHSVWTERMLTRLEQSEPTTKWFRLWDKVLSERNLQAAFWPGCARNCTPNATAVKRRGASGYRNQGGPRSARWA